MSSGSTLASALRLPRDHRPRSYDHWHARLRAGRLDHDLASGIASWQSPAHAARSLQLTTRRKRDSLAERLDSLTEMAEQPARLYLRSPVIQPSRRQVRDAQPLIRAIAARMRDGEPLDARATAALRLLLADGTGPCYGPEQIGALRAALERVTRWL
jgi:hypothetical protein